MGLMTFIQSLARATTPDTGGGSVYPTPTGIPVVTVVNTKTVVSGANWYGRTSMKVKDGVTIMAYREGDSHPDNGFDIINVMFSEDYGENWTAVNTYIDSDPVTGMPSFPANAGTPADPEGPGEPWLYLCPNGDLLIHMWSCDYGVTNQGTYQIRSTDGGKTWDSPALITFVNNTGISISGNLNIFATDDDFVYDGIIYAAAREYLNATSFDSKIRTWLIKSGDNGITWQLVSLLSHYDDVTNEVGITNVQGTKIRALVREFVTKTYYTESTDFGETWTDLVEVQAELGSQSRQRIKSDAQLKLLTEYQNDPVRICNGFIHVNPGSSHPRRIGVWVSKDYGVTWHGPFFMDNAGHDGGYGDMVYNPTLQQYVYTCYFAPWSDTDLNDGIVKQYNFTIEWQQPAVLLSDDFSGTTLNAAKWTKTNPDSANLTLSQNNKLIFTRTTDTAVASTITNYFESVDSFTHGFASLKFSRESGYTNTTIFLSLWADSNNNILIGQAGDTLGGDAVIYCRIVDGGSTVFAFATTVDSTRRLAIEYTEGGVVNFYHWNGARWVSIINTTTGIGITTGVDIGSFKVRMSSNSDADDAAGNIFSLHNFRMTDIRHKYALPENTAIDYQVLLEDNFNGTVIDTAKWTVTNPNAADLTISQDARIIFNRTTDNAVASSLTNTIQSVDSYSGDFVITGKISRSGFANSIGALSAFKDSNNQIQALCAGSGTLHMRVLSGGAGSLVDTGIALTTATRIKLMYVGGVGSAYRYNATNNDWVLVTTASVTLGSGTKVLMGASSTATDAVNDKFFIDDVRVTSADFFNILP